MLFIEVASIFKRFVAIIFISFLSALTGCSTTRLVQAEVVAFAPATIAAGTSFQFERMPSQADSANQQHLESVVAARLKAHGMVASAPDLAVFSVLVSARSQRADPGLELWWADAHGDVMNRHPVLLRNGQLAWVRTWGGAFSGGFSGAFSAPPPLDPTTRHEVSVVVRRSGAVVHEATAKSASRAKPDSLDALNELNALALAALRDFPIASGKASLVQLNIQRAR